MSAELRAKAQNAAWRAQDAGSYFEVMGKPQELARIYAGIDRNGGRLTADSSFSLDLWLEMLDKWFLIHDAEVRAGFAVEDREPEPQGEPSEAERDRRARIQARIHTEHESRWNLGQCKCGAKLGDSIDWNWHLSGVALRAAGVVGQEGEKR